MQQISENMEVKQKEAALFIHMTMLRLHNNPQAARMPENFSKMFFP